MTPNHGHEYRERLPPEAEAMTLAAYLASRYPYCDRAGWHARIVAGQLRVDARVVDPGVSLRRGQVLSWHRPPWTEPAAPLAFAVLHRDEHVLAVAKPPGLPTLPGAGFLAHTLLSLVRARDPQATPVHRLGRWTSGIVLFARNDVARAVLSRQWAARSVRKRYRALVAGGPGQEAFVVDVPIGPVPYAPLGTVYAASPAGKPARSAVAVLERRGATCLCDVRIETGRPHQIRIHLAAAGYPLVGDPLYGTGGVPRAGTSAVPGDPGYLLHAAELGFRHPASGADVSIECAPPPVLRLGGSSGRTMLRANPTAGAAT